MDSTVATPPLDVASAIDSGAWSRFQRITLGLIALAFAVDGLANQALGLAIPALMAEWHVTRGAFASIAGAGLIGVTIGAAGGGVVGDRIGRRLGLIGSVLVFGLMTIAAAGAGNPTQLLVVRFIGGIAIGAALPNGTALIAEFTPLRQRNLAIAIGMMFIAVGGLIASLLGALVLPPFGWRDYFIIAGVMPVGLGLLFVATLPESPLFLARRPHRRTALLVLLRRVGIEVTGDRSLIDHSSAHGRAPVALLLQRGMCRNTLALWTGFFFCLLASYSMFSWAPAMLASQGFGVSRSSIGMSSFSLGGVGGGLISGWLITAFGSRRSVLGLALGAVFGALALGTLAHGPGSSFALLLGALLCEGIFIAGLTNGVYTLAAFIYPPYAKATGVGAAAAIGRIGAVVSSYTGVLALQLGGGSSYFLVIALAALLSFAGIAAVRAHVPRPD
ncbi:MAG TPA: MFS transporter [Steroidobacteraceae bacterium]|nr:MFS transporter [Steroidobacteraceae bacterium]